MFAGYTWPGRTAGYHRAQVRAVLGFREPAAAMRTSRRVGWPRRGAQPSRTGTGAAGGGPRAWPTGARRGGLSGPGPARREPTRRAEPDRADRGYGGGRG